jgi:hypothetical protein
MKRRLTILALATLAVVAFIGVASAPPSPALAGEPRRYRVSAISPTMRTVILRAWAPTSPS